MTDQREQVTIHVGDIEWPTTQTHDQADFLQALQREAGNATRSLMSEPNALPRLPELYIVGFHVGLRTALTDPVWAAWAGIALPGEEAQAAVVSEAARRIMAGARSVMATLNAYAAAARKAGR